MLEAVRPDERSAGGRVDISRDEDVVRVRRIDRHQTGVLVLAAVERIARIPDADVRQLCEMALRGRGLQENHIRMARLMADHQPAVRMQVIDHLRETSDLDPGAWLRRLSHDPAPAVRAAAVRAAANQTQASLVDRIEQMAKNDPSPTVQQVARYYLSCQPPGIVSQPIP